MATRSETRAHGRRKWRRPVLVEEVRKRAGGSPQRVGVEKRNRLLEPRGQPRAGLVPGPAGDRALELEGAEPLVGLDGVEQPSEQAGLPGQRRRQLRDPRPAVHGAIVVR
jgi:hypothetical protein